MQTETASFSHTFKAELMTLKTPSILIFHKMLENSVRNRQKIASIRVRRCMVFLMLALTMGATAFILYGPNQQVLRPLGSWFDELLNNTTTSDTSYFVEYPHQYNFILDEPNRCRQESPFLVLMIPVEPHNSQARDIIRNTWGKETTIRGQVVSHYFLLGLSREQEDTGSIQEEVFVESQRHHDILQSDFLDSYNNLTIKTMMMMEWLSTHCHNTSYAMKIDSDMFLNVNNLVSMLLSAPRQLYMTGLVARNAPVLRDKNSKWFLPFFVFPEPTYPTYTLGLGYVFSLDLPKKILEASANVKALYIEDVYLGLCLRHLGIEVTDPPSGVLFQARMPFFTSNCHWTSVITTILENSKQLLDIWGTYETQIQSGCLQL